MVRRSEQVALPHREVVPRHESVLALLGEHVVVRVVSAIEHGVSVALGRPVSYDEVLTLAEQGEPGARRIVTDAERGLGRLLAAVANLTMPEIIVLGGEGARLAPLARDGIAEGLALDRNERARQIPLVTTLRDDTEWCRGAAVLAIQTHVLES